MLVFIEGIIIYYNNMIHNSSPANGVAIAEKNSPTWIGVWPSRIMPSGDSGLQTLKLDIYMFVIWKMYAYICKIYDYVFIYLHIYVYMKLFWFRTLLA